MSLKHLMALLVIAGLLTACGTEKAEETTEELSLESTEERLSYMVGTNVARQFERDGVTLDIKALQQAIIDIQNGTESRLSEEQIQETIAEIQTKIQERQQAELEERQKEQAELAEKNKAEGEAYLAENGAKEGVVTTESGLQYKELTSGEGETPKAGDTVTVHYKGTLIDGTEFDSSYGRGEPATFPVQGVIPGWVEALQLMQVGDKWELTIPSELAYGPGGTGSTIGPNATLVFEVELLEIASAE